MPAGVLSGRQPNWLVLLGPRRLPENVGK